MRPGKNSIPIRFESFFHPADNRKHDPGIRPIRSVLEKSLAIASLSKGGVQLVKTRLASDFGEYGTIL